MIYALGKFSGANFNLAVSVALGIAKKLEWQDVGIYCATQILAGICAGGCYLGRFGKSFNLQPTAGHSMWQAGLAELLYTFMLCIVVLNAAASKFHAGNNRVFGITIGLVIVARAYSGGRVSMVCFKHVVGFGIDVACAFLFSVGLNVLSGSAAAAFSIAASLMCMIFALRTFSGAHFNPWRVRGWRRCKFTWVCRFLVVFVPPSHTLP